MSKILATPAARKAAKEKNIDLRVVKGSGKYGAVLLRDLENVSPVEEKKGLKITPVAKNAMNYYNVDIDKVQNDGVKVRKDDVLRAVKWGDDKEQKAPKYTTLLEDKVIPYKGMRKAIGDNMTASIVNAPQVSHFADIDTTDFMNVFENTKKVFKEKYGKKLTVTDLLIKAVCLTLEKCPKVNTNFDGKEIHRRDTVNIGLAVAQEDGLVVPVFNGIENKSIFEICDERSEIVPQARENKLSGKYYRGATFTISNTGRSVNNFFTPIVNPGEVAILGVGRTAQMPAVVDGEIVVRTFTGFSVTIDHRVLDGMDAVNFLNTLNEVLSNPISILL
ncbi:dihydrolipoamide acetyltransferase family protein [Anaerofustis sp.]|uniref:dihydrolipoamide acetyltransferase family protein n=1 Tax=Anaerofustis sp. TaxID=1872517 RepID=UPI0025BC6CDB|nr:dihydrolipoamide acetyltransferase family protein [Anaerofustis sp.]